MPAKKKSLVASLLVVYKDAGGEWRWKALASNNEIVADSGEGYNNKAYTLKVGKQLFPSLPYEFR